MKLRAWIGLGAAALGAIVCARLGFWQLSRWHEKQRLNAQLRAAAELPPVQATASPPPLASLRGRYLAIRGRYDHSRQVLLAGRAREGAPGVEVVTPLLLDGGTAVLVDRGWLYSPDAARARPQDYPEPGRVEVVGPAEPLPLSRSGPAWRELRGGDATLWSTRLLDRDSVAARLPYAIAPYLVRQVPGPGVPTHPTRRAPRALDESMHLSYAIQWFSFATILLVGPAFLARSGRRKASA